jgi:hypothetical protein
MDKRPDITQRMNQARMDDKVSSLPKFFPNTENTAFNCLYIFL